MPEYSKDGHENKRADFCPPLEVRNRMWAVGDVSISGSRFDCGKEGELVNIACDMI